MPYRLPLVSVLVAAVPVVVAPTAVAGLARRNRRHLCRPAGSRRISAAALEAEAQAK